MLHEQLKAATRPLHQQLDAAPLLKALLKPTLDHATYVRVLKTLAIAHAQAESRLGALSVLRPTGLPRYVPRLPLLQQELCALEGRAVALDLETPHPAPLSSVNHYIGLRYVLEGSSQGAPFILNRLAINPALLPLGPNGYWPRLAGQTAGWHALLELLADPACQLNPAQVIQGARTGFHIFLTVFSHQSTTV